MGVFVKIGSPALIADFSLSYVDQIDEGSEKKWGKIAAPNCTVNLALRLMLDFNGPAGIELG